MFFTRHCGCLTSLFSCDLTWTTTAIPSFQQKHFAFTAAEPTITRRNDNNNDDGENYDDDDDNVGVDDDDDDEEEEIKLLLLFMTLQGN